jgi:methylglutaconyl-CoA hydratase
VIARVQGDAYAGGVGLLAACDIVFAAVDAEFCLSETRLGLIPATISPYLVRAMGARQARRYLLTAEKFTAAEAYRIGLVHELASLAELDERVNALLGALMQASPAAVGAAKRLVRDVAGRPIDETLREETVARMADVRASEDGREGIASFLEKRKPRWVREFEAELEPQPGDTAAGA